MAVASVAALAVFLGRRIYWQLRPADTGLIVALIQPNDLLGQSFEQLIDVLAGLGTGLHEGHLVLIRCITQ
jgi:hypothetical protein